jgi:hypothetical protein
MNHQITTQRELRRRFWQDNPQADRRRITDHSGAGKMHTTDTRCIWCDYIDAQHRAGLISDELADRATL